MVVIILFLIMTLWMWLAVTQMSGTSRFIVVVIGCFIPMGLLAFVCVLVVFSVLHLKSGAPLN